METLINICLGITVLFNLILAVSLGCMIIPEMYARYKARKHVKRFVSEVVNPILKEMEEEMAREATERKRKKVSPKTK